MEHFISKVWNYQISQHWLSSFFFFFLAIVNELRDVSALPMLFPEAWMSAHSTGRLDLYSLQ